MSSLRTVEIDGALVGILTHDHAERSFYFHSGVAPYDLLDGSRFTRVTEAQDAVRRMSKAARQARSAANIRSGDEP
jgi:hypothetical protein